MANLLTRMQEWDYYLGIAGVKRMQGLYQATLVAQGAFSVYRTEKIKDIGGWPDAIGEDIVVTWRLLEQGGRVIFEPTAVAFTVVPTNVVHFMRQRARWARGMFEGIRAVPPWRQRRTLAALITDIDFLIPLLDVGYVLIWLPGLILFLFGIPAIVSAWALTVVPITPICTSTAEAMTRQSALRKALEDRGVFYVLAVPMNQRVIAKTTGSVPGGEWRADELIASLPATAWRTRSAGNGSKGDRRYGWARARINGARDPDAEYWLLARRSLADPTEIAYYLTHGPKRVALAELARAAGARWAIEESFQTSKGQTGLDHYQVRQYTGWYRHITLSMLAHAFLTVTRSKKGATSRRQRPHRPEPARNQAPPRLPGLQRAAGPRTRPEPLTLATPTSTNRETTSLSNPRTRPINATVVLGQIDMRRHRNDQARAHEAYWE
ncbi:Transposase DDE domain-containing protein [Cryobacterium psychrotolerans]|uniref:Transposase DDE domain-containing protein n=1 Tax=Cryobacterium psychrotolerans TaxID=386301 RepID=A0A1G9GZ01_9MICO|nr:MULTISPECIES: glycosyltransferase family 2 protein [Cryobacterium]TFD48510.1 hypothetical protein E3T33_01470 [Cryobacterium sp. TMT1-2-1]TFD86700.1 hypothetical protein E3T56_06730 [Cryobacterium psychrotolerans]SDL05881.1 Transposase DDE domain-containing protein [Cryobacterium psychrotolerans]